MKKHKNKSKIAAFPGAFDPFHNGQLDVLLKAINHYHFQVFIIPLIIFNESEKQTTRFTLQERVEIIKNVLRINRLEEKVSIKILSKDRGCLKSSIRQFIREEKINFIIRGKRPNNYKNELLKKESIEEEFGIKVFLIKSSKENENISSSSIKEELNSGRGINGINKLVTKEVKEKIKDFIKNKIKISAPDSS